MDETLHFYHAAQSRSTSVHALLEELGAPYQLHRLDLKAGDNRQPDYLAVNPLGKVPAIRHRGEVVTEQVAIFLHLADRFPEAGLVVFGHSHLPLLQTSPEGLTLLNPGSPTERRRAPRHTMAQADVADGAVVCELLALD